MHRVVLLIALSIFSSPIFAATYQIETDCRNYTTETPQTGDLGDDGLSEILAGDIIEITFKGWTSRSASTTNAYDWVYDKCGGVTYGNHPLPNGNLKLANWYDSSRAYETHLELAQSSELTLTLEAKSTFLYSETPFSMG
mgnify:CR=1 FL=1